MKKHERKTVTIRELAEGYKDDGENGVVGYDGKLDIRPPYQREFVYKDKERTAVIETIFEQGPLSEMHWAIREDGTFEVMDGQQRTISICQYTAGDFAVDKKYFHNLSDEEQNKIYDYKLYINVFNGTDDEKLKWFKTINIAGIELTDQELRNAVYHGPWVAEAKRYFSKTGCAAYQISSDYLKGSAIRQDYLEIAIKWISNDDIEEYMAKHQHDSDADELWEYFNNVIDWVKTTFPEYRKEMKGVDWGKLYNEYKDMYKIPEDIDALSKQVGDLMADEEVVKKQGIYYYVFDGFTSHLNSRVFMGTTKRTVFEKQGGKCNKCKESFVIEAMEADHIIPHSKGGNTDISNCQMLCSPCNRNKSAA